MPQVRNTYSSNKKYKKRQKRNTNASNKKYKCFKSEIQMLQIRNTNVSNRKCEEERKSDI